MSRAKAKEDSYRATVATFVLKKIHTMFWTHLQREGINFIHFQRSLFRMVPELLQCHYSLRKRALQG